MNKKINTVLVTAFREVNLKYVSKLIALKILSTVYLDLKTI